MGSWSRNLGYLCFNNHSANSRRNSAPPPLGRAARAWLLTRELSYVRVNEANTRERAKQSISVAWRHSKQFHYYFLRWSMDNRKTVFLLSMFGVGYLHLHNSMHLWSLIIIFLCSFKVSHNDMFYGYTWNFCLWTRAPGTSLTILKRAA